MDNKIHDAEHEVNFDEHNLLFSHTFNLACFIQSRLEFKLLS